MTPRDGRGAGMEGRARERRRVGALLNAPGNLKGVMMSGRSKIDKVEVPGGTIGTSKMNLMVISFFLFSPLPAKMIQFDEHIFQTG